MERLNNIKNYHLGMGMLIILIQVGFQFSNLIYLFGAFLILFSCYESFVFDRLLVQKHNEKRIDQILNQFKWSTLISLVPFLLFVAAFLIEAKGSNYFFELLHNDLVFFINVSVIGIVMIYFSMNAEIRKIKREIINTDS